jgi:hypothetical protein
MSSAPGRTRTGSLLFRRCLGLDAVPERELAGRQRPWSESYQLVGLSRAVTLSNENARSRIPACPPYRRCTAAVGRSQTGRRSSGRFPPRWVLRRTLAYPSTAMPAAMPLVAPSESGVAAPQGALRAMGSSACRRVLAGLRLVPPPAATSAEPGATHRVQRPYPPWSCVASTKMFPNPRLEITSSAAAGVHGLGRRCCAQPMVHK